MSPFNSEGSIPEALQQLRLRLLDLTARNRLLNFRHSPTKTIQVVDAIPIAVYDRLLDNKSLTYIPVPDPDPSEYLDENRRQKPDVRDYAKKRGISTNYELARVRTNVSASGREGARLRVLAYPEDLERLCRRMAKEARSAIEETGSNMLYMVFGFLEYYENNQSEKPLLAPLIAIPVALKRGTIDPDTRLYRYDLSYTGEELSENLSLREKLKQDFSLQLPEFDDEAGPEDYFEKIENAISKRPRWKVRRQITLALLSFAKMMLVLDLDPKNWPTGQKASSLVENDLVRMTFGDLPADDGGGTEPDPHDVDNHTGSSISLIYDADTSQYSALIDALAGKNLVINGPPGTGKSQTITNLIAEAMVRGKKVLFVSEKLAAMEVVKDRLERAGLGHFCLELHSHKTQKKRLLDELNTRLNTKFQASKGLEGQLQLLVKRKKDLQQYADLMNSVIGNALDLKIFDVIWKAERYRREAGSDTAEAVESLIVANAPTSGAETLGLMQSAVEALARHFEEIRAYREDHPWFGFFPLQLAPGDDLTIQSLLNAVVEGAEAVDEATAALCRLVNMDGLSIGKARAEEFANALSQIQPPADDVCVDLLLSFFPDCDLPGTEAASVLNSLHIRIGQAKQLISETTNKLNLDAEISSSMLNRAKSARALLHRHGLDLISVEEIASRKSELEKCAAVAERSLDFFTQLESTIGSRFISTDIGVKRFVAMLSVSYDAPKDLLEYRLPSFPFPSTRELLNKVRSELDKLKCQHHDLDQIFYLDERPNDETLQHAIRTFREGDAWYRFLQGEWRRARKFYKTLAKNKKKCPTSDCLAHLSALAEFLRAHEQLTGNREYQEAFGRLFRGDKTEIDKIERLIGWYERALAVLFSAGLPPPDFDLTTLEVHRIAQMAEQYPLCETHVKALHEVGERLTDLVRGTVFETEFAKADLAWPRRIEIARVLAKDFADAAEIFSILGPPQRTAMEIVTALEGRLVLDSLTRDIEQDCRAQALLKERFAGLETALPPLMNTLAWGQFVTRQPLPQSIARRLLSAETHSVLPHVKEASLVLHQAWQFVETFSNRMQELGDFHWKQWNAASMCEDPELTTKLIRARANLALANLDGLLPWSQYLYTRQALEELGLRAFAEKLESGAVDKGLFVSGFLYRFYSSIAQSVFRAHPVLARFSGTTHNQIREEFARLDREIIALRGKDCAAKIGSATAFPRGMSGVRVDDKTEMELLKHLMSLQRPRTSIRQIMKRAGRSVQALKPCFMMGPLAVAQYLEPGAVKFDLVIMDEASQLKPEEAIGSIARGAQLLVVGDPKQLPPTSFFDRMMSVEDEEEDIAAAAATSESILDIGIGLFPTRTLKWHYRSKHESLIAFSNHHFYDGKLIVFPSPYPKTNRLGLCYHHIADGVYQNRQNIPEAMRVVDAVVDHMQTRSEDSLGVVTLNITQRDLIEELLEKRLRSFEKGEEYKRRWELEGWPFFIKNLENVQGDERDVIFVATTFGKPPGTHVVRQNFGPISRPNGWRRLNVLFTRARKSAHVFSSMQYEDIMLDGKTPDGTRALRNYLEYAARGNLVGANITPREPDTDFEVAVADALRTRGFEVQPQLGVAGYFIDIAVRNPVRPGQFLAAIECDGASYHSGSSVRDRDRIRQEILEGLGWRGKIWRIWSPDWFRNPKRETDRLLQFLEHLQSEAAEEPSRAVEEDKPGEITTADISAQTPLVQPDFFEGQQVSEDEVLYVEVGDRIVYTDLRMPDQRKSFLISDGPSKFDVGIINENAPLAQAFLGAAEGEEVELRVPGHPTQSLRLLKIERSNPG